MQIGVPLINWVGCQVVFRDQNCSIEYSILFFNILDGLNLY